MNTLTRFTLACATSALLAACATSPLGRNQLILVSDGEMSQLGAASFTEMKTKTPLSRDARQSAYVQCVAGAITREAGTGQQWEVQVFDEPKTVNAFALPGGKIGVYTGLLNVAKTQDQLAAVIGHELSHVLARHSAERMSEQMAAQGVTQIVAASTGVDPQAIGIAGTVFFTLPHSRTQESEADLLGLDLMARAGFDPNQAVELWRNMEAASGGSAPPQFLSTHPANATRIQDLNNRLPTALPLYRQAKAAGKSPHCS